MNKLKIGISPCPNDTFIFEAIFDQRVSLKDVAFEFIFEDVETLNQMALNNELDIVKISYANYFSVMENYIMLKSGGAMGKGVGPLLIAKQPMQAQELSNKKTGIPGLHTTANFLLTFAFPFLEHKIVYRFDQIENAVLDQEVEAGVIIHENRFTYAARGLHLIKDLGSHWEEQTGLPIPLGGIAVRRTLPHAMCRDINTLIKESIAIAGKQAEILSPFIKNHAQEMDEKVMRKHIDLYVNEFSVDAGHSGLLAVHKMQEVMNINRDKPLFI